MSFLPYSVFRVKMLWPNLCVLCLFASSEVTKKNFRMGEPTAANLEVSVLFRSFIKYGTILYPERHYPDSKISQLIQQMTPDVCSIQQSQFVGMQMYVVSGHWICSMTCFHVLWLNASPMRHKFISLRYRNVGHSGEIMNLYSIAFDVLICMLPAAKLSVTASAFWMESL